MGLSRLRSFMGWTTWGGEGGSEAIGMTLERVALTAAHKAGEEIYGGHAALVGYGVQSAAAARKNERAPSKVPCTSPLSIQHGGVFD